MLRTQNRPFRQMKYDGVKSVRRVRLVVQHDPSYSHCSKHPVYPHILPFFLDTFLTGWWGLGTQVSDGGDVETGTATFSPRK